jgi:hypothetical protein
MKSVIMKNRERCDRIPLESPRAESQPHNRVDNNYKEGGGMARRLSDVRGPMLLDRLRHPNPISF